MKDRIDEREKWNKIYSSQDIDTFGMEYPFGEFDKEFQETVTQLLPNGGKIIEIGSGGGWQSLFLAKTGIFDVTLLDFSEQALQFSKSLFAKEGLQAKFVHRDAFIFGEPEYDLVFNAGVLEHYNFAEQLKLIRAMASYSRKFVLVLTPNTSCYWYWVWRINLSYKGEWLYGKEIPIVTMADLFEQSGLLFVGDKFMG
ncbi:MAG: class I SAM-dependent methyltransferase, partial [Nitrososphaerota archaeon]